MTNIGAPDYRVYIASDEWKARRTEALKRSKRGNGGFLPSCELCGKTGIAYKNTRSQLDPRERSYRVDHANGLQVHHVHYRNLGFEEPDDLVVLCTDACYKGARGVGCHERVHDGDTELRREVARLAAERRY